MARKIPEYDEKYCDELIEHCSRGLSPTSFAGRIRISRALLYRWVATNPDFHDAMEVARAARATWYEEQGREILMKGGTGGQAAILQFTLKNIMPEDWRDRQEITGAEGRPLFEDTDPKRLAATVMELLKDAAPKKDEKLGDQKGFGPPEDRTS